MTPKQQLIQQFRALCDAEGGVDAVAEAIRASAESLKQVYRGTTLPSGEPRGLGPTIQKKLEAKFPGWANRQHLILGEAHSVSYGIGEKVITKRVTWEQLVMQKNVSDLGHLFVSAMPDDANAPDFPKGLEVMWSTTKTPTFGSLVLVRDKHGQLHAREYRQGDAPKRWKASASNPAFFTFDSVEHGLRVVAVAAFRALP